MNQAEPVAMHGVLIDLDGVIWESDKVVPGAPQAIDWLIAEGIPYLFVTNTTSRPRRLIAAKLKQLGIAATAQQILTPPVAAAQWLLANTAGPAALLVPSATEEDFADISSIKLDDAADVSAIVVGDIGEAWNYSLLNTAFRVLMRESPPQLIALGMTRYWHAKDGLRLDVAPFVTALEHAASCKAIVLGKPSADFFSIALNHIGCDAANTVMVGDDVHGDVQGAQDAGLTGMLVKTGKFRPQDLQGNVTPDALLDSIADLPDWQGKQLTKKPNS
jgi:phospholysine phosphohistidine inorganic pyrophosphate phosphatase